VPALRREIPGDAGYDLTPMDSPAPTSGEASHPEWALLSEEQKRNYRNDVNRFEEEKFASRNSFPTKLLGWMLIASFGFQIAGAISGNGIDFGGLLFLFTGIYILNGSQSALRFATFIIAPAAVIGLLKILWCVALRQPLEINKDWRDYRDLKFWTLGVSPCMYFVAEAIVATCAFRLRKIPFWTKTVRVWAGVFGVIFLLQLIFFARNLVRLREVRRSFPKELAAAEAYFSTYGRGISTASMRASEQTFGELPNLLQVDWKNSPNSTTQIYRKVSGGDTPSGKRLDHQVWLKLPSGEWGKIEMKLILPENP
jgi:hypothetical protein